MSSSPPRSNSPPNSHTGRATPAFSKAPSQPAPSTSTSYPVETPRSTSGTRSQSTPPVLLLDRSSITSNPRPTIPLIFIHDSYVPQIPPHAESNSRQGRSLVARHALRNSTSQPSRRIDPPYARLASLVRARSQPHPDPNRTSATMSSASSSPSNTPTAGATPGSSSNPTYQLPYAPFPYHVSGNGGGQQGGKSGSGK